MNIFFTDWEYLRLREDYNKLILCYKQNVTSNSKFPNFMKLFQIGLLLCKDFC